MISQPRPITSPLMAVLAALVGACAKPALPNDENPEVAEKPAYLECTEPRPELCTQHYDPVCAQRDTGIRCVTTPCDSSEWLGYANACMACADPDVYGYQAGTCEEPEPESPAGKN